MKPARLFPPPRAMARHAAALATVLAVSTVPTVARAQWSACTSDQVPPPLAVMERFMSANCEACWGEPATPSPQAPALVLDWIVPTEAGDEAPLSTAATRDALARLQAVGRPVPESTDVFTAPVPPALPGHAPTSAAARPALRLALGPAINDYVAASVRVRAPLQPATFWLALVEAIPPSSEGTQVPRFVVRNTFLRPMDEREQLSKWKQKPPQNGWWQQIIPMRIPEGARPERLRLMGWVETAPGEVLASAYTVCR